MQLMTKMLNDYEEALCVLSLLMLTMLPLRQNWIGFSWILIIKATQATLTFNTHDSMIKALDSDVFEWGFFVEIKP